MASSIFGSLTGALGSLFGGTNTLNTIGQFGDFALGAYDLYQGYNAQQQANDYMKSLGASYQTSDALLREQADRAKRIYHPVEDLQAGYALEDLQRYRPLQIAQQQYGIDRNQDRINFAQNTIDPTEDQLLTFLSEGADPQRYRDRASANVEQGASKALDATNRAMARMGINPNSGAFADMLKKTNIANAAAHVDSRTKATQAAEDLDTNRKMQALNYWKGIPFDMTTAPQSGQAMSQTAITGFQNAATGLANAANIAQGNAADYFAGATSTFGNIGGYLTPSPQQSNLQTGPAWNQYSSGPINPGYIR